LAIVNRRGREIPKENFGGSEGAFGKKAIVEEEHHNSKDDKMFKEGVTRETVQV